MISVTCPRCRTKLKVKDQAAGKQVRCPHCQANVAVPGIAPARVAPPVPIIEDATLPPQSPPADREPPTLPPQARPRRSPVAHESERREIHANEESTEALEGATRYQVAGEIARGGMGAIMRAVDQDIRREVAVKFLLNQADGLQKARFIEEAQITGQLEHPNIVPIHQLGVNAEGRCFFSMKMVKGLTLSEILDDQRADFTLGRQLAILVSICNALAYAHSRNVIHRDLKPANVMVGDFGEVYVMDWGLAKVLGQDEPPAPPNTAIKRKPSGQSTVQGTASDSKSGDKVVTQRGTDSQLTQAGAIMGTPAYMPPEQALGESAAIDQRSDIYSLGAILYEILTLTPPVGRGGDYMAVLMRVVEGRIEAPEQRAPERARLGLIPPELSAVALKALAKDPADRYQTVEALQRDIQLFLEGRSVSAKQDTIREVLWKLVKRNKGISVGLAIAFLVFLGSLAFLLAAWQETRSAYAAFQKEQEEKQAQALKSVPALVRAARLMANENQLDDAMSQVTLAVGIDHGDASARLLRGQLLIGAQDYQAAQTELKECLKLRPDNAAAQKLLKLCELARSDNSGQLLALAEELSRQKAFTLADKVTRQAEKLLGSREELSAHYRKRIEAALPGSASALGFDALGQFSLTCANHKDLNDLGFLQGMKLAVISLYGCSQVRDLAPLKGMPLTSLNLYARPGSGGTTYGTGQARTPQWSGSALHSGRYLRWERKLRWKD